MYSKAYSIQMNQDVPDAERRIAEKASEAFEHVLSELKLASEHLDEIYTPFIKAKQISSDDVVKNRDILRKYRDEAEEKFDRVSASIQSAVTLMSDFATDSTVEELMRSFVSSARELKKQVDYFLSIFSNLNNPEFKNQLISAIDSVKKQSSQLKQLVNDRVLEHIDTNILAKNWESLVNDNYQETVNDNMIQAQDFYKERFKVLKS